MTGNAPFAVMIIGIKAEQSGCICAKRTLAGFCFGALVRIGANVVPARKHPANEPLGEP